MVPPRPDHDAKGLTQRSADCAITRSLVHQPDGQVCRVAYVDEVALLVLLNGPPASGKSTLATRLVRTRPMALNLDIDLIRGQLGAWTDSPADAGVAARRLAVSMTATHLADGHDVVVPQFLARKEFIAELADTAERAGSAFCRDRTHRQPCRSDRGIRGSERLTGQPAAPRRPHAHRTIRRTCRARRDVRPIHRTARHAAERQADRGSSW
jgi:hypothetical protein